MRCPKMLMSRDRGCEQQISALLLLQPALDANYQIVKAAAYVWQQPPVPQT